MKIIDTSGAPLNGEAIAEARRFANAALIAKKRPLKKVGSALCDAGTRLFLFVVTLGESPVADKVVVLNATNFLTVTASNITVVYGQPDPSLTFMVVGLIPGDTIIGTLERAAGADVGTYAISQGSLAGSGHPYTIRFTAGTFTITQAPMAITANPLTKTYGDTDPLLTYSTANPLFNGDIVTGHLTRVAGENVGTYAIQQGTLGASSNYAVTFTGALLTIIKAAQSIYSISITWTAGTGNPPIAGRDPMVGDTGVVTAYGGLSGNPLTFASSNTSACTVSASTLIGSGSTYVTYQATVTAVGAGSVTIVGSQAGGSNFLAAPSPPLAGQFLTFTIGSAAKPVLSVSTNPLTVGYTQQGDFFLNATAGRGGTLAFSFVSCDTVMTPSFFGSGPSYTYAAFARGTHWYGTAHAQVKVTETAGGIAIDSDPVTLTVTWSPPPALALYSITSGQHITVRGGDAPYQWVFMQSGVTNGLSFADGLSGISGGVGTPLAMGCENIVSLASGYCGAGFVRCTDYYGSVVDIPFTSLGIASCGTTSGGGGGSGTPLTITIISKGKFLVSGGASGGYTVTISPATTPPSVGGVSIWTDGTYFYVTSTSGCYCDGAGVKAMDTSGAWKFAAFSSAFGPAAICTSGCPGSGTGGTGGKSWVTVYSCGSTWVGAPVGSGFEGSATYQATSNDGQYRLTYGYADCEFDICSSWSAMNSSAGSSLNYADFSLAAIGDPGDGSPFLPAGVCYHLISLDHLQ